nr:hypothetical transcript [Hymenolepis microstoma]
METKMNNLFESVQRLEDSNKHLWNKVSSLSLCVKENDIMDDNCNFITYRKPSLCKKREDMIIPCLQFSNPISYIAKLDHRNPTTVRLSPSLLKTYKKNDEVRAELGSFYCKASLSQYQGKRESNDVFPSPQATTMFMKPENMSMLSNSNGRDQQSQANKEDLQKFPVRTVAHFHPQRINSVKMECSKKSSDLSNNITILAGSLRPTSQESDSSDFNDQQPQAGKRFVSNLQIPYQPEGRFPSENGRPYFWYMDSSFEPSTKSSTSDKKLSSIPSITVNLSPGIKEEVNQMRSMILLVMEELVNTESSYLRILSQFILLREEIFTPNWRADRQKFMRLFPATVDELCKLHRDSCEAMRHAYDQIPQHTREQEALLETSIRDESSFKSHRYRSNVPTHQPHRSHRRHLSYKSTGENEIISSSNCTEVSQDSASPFTVLLEMIEGRRPLGTSPNSSYCSAPIWSTSLLFKLYTRYLSEFSGSIQTLSKMKTGPTSLRKQLKQLQSHPACEFNDITTYLLAPVQRLPRYRLLIQKMIQYTEKMYRLLGIKSARKQDSRKVIPDLPSLEELKRADDALHKMLMELDEMMDMDMVDLKMECISGGAEGTQKFAKKNSETGVVCSNNCSENGIKRTISKLLPGEVCREDHISRCRRSQSLVDPEGRKSRARSTGRTGLWSRLKRFRFTFSSSHNYPEDKDEISKQTVTVLTSDSAKEPVDGKESQKSIPVSTNVSPNITPLGSVRFQETTSNQLTVERTGSKLDKDYASKVESWNKMSSARIRDTLYPRMRTDEIAEVF